MVKLLPALLLPALFLVAGCGGASPSRDGHSGNDAAALPAAGAADAVRTAKPGTAPAATPTPGAGAGR